MWRAAALQEQSTEVVSQLPPPNLMLGQSQIQATESWGGLQVRPKTLLEPCVFAPVTCSIHPQFWPVC